MKRLILVLLLFNSCNGLKSNQEKAQILAKKLLDSTLNDAKSYESIKFTKLDTLYAPAARDPKFKAFEHSYDSLKFIDSINSSKIYTSSISELRQVKANVDRYYIEKKKILDEETAFLDHYKGKPIGWHFTHTFRARNGFGALVVGTTYFEFNKDLTEVTHVNDVKDETN